LWLEDGTGVKGKSESSKGKVGILGNGGKRSEVTTPSCTLRQPGSVRNDSKARENGGGIGGEEKVKRKGIDPVRGKIYSSER